MSYNKKEFIEFTIYFIICIICYWVALIYKITPIMLLFGFFSVLLFFSFDWCADIEDNKTKENKPLSYSELENKAKNIIKDLKWELLVDYEIREEEQEIDFINCDFEHSVGITYNLKENDFYKFTETYSYLGSYSMYYIFKKYLERNK